METESAYQEWDDEARKFEALGLDRRACEELRDALEFAREHEEKAYQLYFEGRLARLEGDETTAYELLTRASLADPRSGTIRRGLARFLLELNIEGDRELRDRHVRLQAWRRLSARVAHRIDNQLSVSQGALRTLKKLQDPEAAEAVADLEASRDAIHRIICEFQRFSKNEPPALAPTQVGPLARDAVRRVGQRTSQVSVAAEIEEGLAPCALDARQFGEVLGELLENALHHTPPGGNIRVSAKPAPASAPPRVLVTVEDTGKGVAAGDKERIFEPFFSRRPGGMGLGLAIVKQIVENHRGTIRETGQEGSGARFEIELPACAEEETAHENPGN